MARTKEVFASALMLMFSLSMSGRTLKVAAEQLPVKENTDDVTEFVISGHMSQALKFDDKSFRSLKHLVYDGDVDYISGSSFQNCPELETVTFNGLVGHSDGYCFFDCPKLRSVTFNGPVYSTGGALYMRNCPVAEKVVFNGLVISAGFGDNDNCPSFKGYEINGAIVNADEISTSSDSVFEARRDEFMPQLEKISSFIATAATSEKSEFLFKLATCWRPDLSRILSLYNAEYLADTWVPSGKFNDDPDRYLAKLDLLKKSAPYKTTGTPIEFQYTPPTDSALTATRIRFNLDSVAGNGDEISRIKNLLHFVHETIRHDGGSTWPDVPFNFGALYDICQKENRGLNCRFMAIMLTEALLAEGIPARYLTCMPKYYDTDGDCHVITIAWSSQLGKWVWVDPTWDAWVTDENGTMLHPGEVRHRLIDGQPLLLSEGANWNHKSNATVESYLENYMAKNLYIITANSINRPEPEGQKRTTSGPQGEQIALVPLGITYLGQNDTTDDTAFWAAPTTEATRD